MTILPEEKVSTAEYWAVLESGLSHCLYVVGKAWSVAVVVERQNTG